MDSREAQLILAISTIIFFFCTLLLFFSWLYFSFKKSILKLKQKLAVSQITSLEYERERIAADLHDEIGPFFAVIKLQFEQFIHQDRIKVEDITKVIAYLTEAVQKLENISWNLMPKSIEIFGLNETIKELIEKFTNNKRLTISFETNYSKSRSKEVDLQLYRIIQEAILNAQKHGNASLITIKLKEEKKSINLIISDNGTGITKDQLDKFKGNGLKSIRNRALLLGGELLIDTMPTTGTILTINIPI